MSIDPHTAAAISEVDRAVTRGQSLVRAYRVEGRGLAAGRAIIRRDGELSDDDETYARLLPGKPTPGLDAVLLPIGGKDVHIGNIYQGLAGVIDIGAGLQAALFFPHSQTAADNTPTSSTASFVDIITVSVVLPGDTTDDWTIIITGGCNLAHSTAASVDRRVALNNTGGPESGASMDTTREHYYFPEGVFADIPGGDTYTARLQYKMSAAGGSASARAAGILAIAVRES